MKAFSLPRFFLLCLGALALCLLLFAFFSSEPSAGIRIDHSGLPQPTQITISEGSCGHLRYSESETESMASIECDAPVGAVTIFVHCADKTLPPARVVNNYPNGDSHHAVFRDVCSSTKAEIEAGNAAKRQSFIWVPVRAKTGAFN